MHLYAYIRQIPIQDTDMYLTLLSQESVEKGTVKRIYQSNMHQKLLSEGIAQR